MASTVRIARLLVNVTAQTTEFEKGMKQLERALDRSVKHVEEVGRSLSTALTVPLLALGAAAGKMALDFDDNFQRMTVVMGESEEAAKRLKDSVLQLAGATGERPKELAKALDEIRASGFRGEAALQVLKVSAMGTAIQLGELGDVSKVVTSAMNAYGTANLSAAKAAGVLLKMQREGNLKAEDVAEVMGKTAPIAAQLGISFDQLGAAMAVMSRGGLGASQAAAALQTILATLIKPSKGAQEALGEVGLVAGALRQELKEKGLLSVLQTLQERFKGHDDALTKLFPSMKTFGGVLTLLGTDAKAAETTFKNLAKVTGEDLGKAFGKLASDPGFRMNQALTQINVVLIRLGDQILPALVPMVTQFSRAMGDLAKMIAEASPEARGLGLMLAGIAIVAGPALLAIGKLAHGLSATVSAFRLLAGPLVRVVTLLAGLGGAMAALVVLNAVVIGYLVANWKSYADDLSTILEYIEARWREVFGDRLSGFMRKFFDNMLAQLGSFGMAIKLVMTMAFDGGVEASKVVMGKLQTSVTASFDALVAKAKGFAAELGAAIGQVKDMPMPNFSGGALPGAPKTDEKTKTDWEDFFSVTEEKSGPARQKLVDLGLASNVTSDQFKASVRGMGNATAQSMGAMTASFAKGAMSLNQFVEQMILAIGKLILKIILLKALTSAGLGGPFAEGFIGGAFADGGRPPRGKVSLVGERGPELFVPDTAGTIVPFAGGGAGPIIVEQSFAIEVSGGAGDAAAIRRMINAIKDAARSGSADGVELALQLRQTADLNDRRAV